MIIETSRFGPIRCDEQDLFFFPEGLIGMGHARHWLYLSHCAEDSVVWMQCASHDIAIALVDPRHYVPDYQLRVSSLELEPLKISAASDAIVFCVLSETDDQRLSVNLKAPIVLNSGVKLGRQVLANGQPPVRHVLQLPSTTAQRKAA